MSLFIMSPCYCPDATPADGLMATARRVGLEPHLYGVGQQITTNCSNAQGTDMLALMEQRTESHIMCVDSMDMAFLAGEQEIMDKFLAFKSGLVMSGERDGIAGLIKTKQRLHEMCLAARGYHSHLNIGGWIGERAYAVHVFKEAERLYRPIPEDSYNYDVLPQWLMQMKARMGVGGEPGPEGPTFELDWQAALFQSMNQTAGELVWDAQMKRMHNMVTGTLPVLLHYNGDKTYRAYREMVRQITEG
jgi:hypothetical protein